MIYFIFSYLIKRILRWKIILRKSNNLLFLSREVKKTVFRLLKSMLRKTPCTSPPSSVLLSTSRSLTADPWNPLSDTRVNLRRALANSINKFISPIIALKPRSSKRATQIQVMTVWKETAKS